VNEVDAIPSAGRLAVYGAQHVLAMYAGAVAVPLIVGGALHLTPAELVGLINADLLTCGLATLLQTLGFAGFGIRLPVVQGVTFAAVTPIIVIGKTSGMPAVYGAILCAGIATILWSPIAGRLLRLFPPVVTGTIITIIGLTLLPVAAHWAVGGWPGDPAFGAPSSLALAGVVLVLVLLFERLLRGFFRSIAVLLGLACGTLIAAALGHVDLSGVGSAPWVAMTRPFAFGVPRFEWAPIASLCLLMLVTTVETTGAFLAVGEITERPVAPRDVVRGLRADGLSTLLGGILNSFPYTAYAQNVGLVALTGVKSRYVVAAAGGLLVLLGLLPKAGALVAAVPGPVLGGAGLVMFGTVAQSGIRALTRVRFDGTRNGLIVAVSIAVSFVPMAVPEAFAKFPSGVQILLGSGISLGSLAAILLHVLIGERQ